MARFQSARSSEGVREYNVNYDNYIMGKTNLYKIKPIFFPVNRITVSVYNEELL